LSIFGSVSLLKYGKVFNFVVGGVVATIIAYVWLTNPNWLIVDFIALCIITNTLIAFPRISLKTLIVVCFALIIYDVLGVYVFGVMQDFAYKAYLINMPLLIVIPKTLSLQETQRLFMLGLGDIIIPGLLIREEILRAKENIVTAHIWNNIPLMPVVLSVGYVFGFAAVQGVLYYTHKPQPALVFLLPSMLILLGCAYYWESKKK
jgi:minor histocompatibility antigen H13